MAEGTPLAEVRAEIAAGQAESADEFLLEWGDPRWSVLEDAIARRAWVVGVFTDEAEARRRWQELAPLLPAKPTSEPAFRSLAQRDWADSYKEHFKAWSCGRLHWVPIWERGTYSLPAGSAVLWLDPGLAFGTGNHETTRLCCERLVALAEKRPAGRVLDAGCGSGILALSAAVLGFDDVAGFDCDPEAVRVSRQNAALNGLETRAHFHEADIPAGVVGRAADIVLANIQADVLVRHAGELTKAVAPGGSLVLSGILAAEIDLVRSAFASVAPDWKSDSRTLGEWSDLLLGRPSML